MIGEVGVDGAGGLSVDAHTKFFVVNPEEDFSTGKVEIMAEHRVRGIGVESMSFFILGAMGRKRVS